VKFVVCVYVCAVGRVGEGGVEEVGEEEGLDVGGQEGGHNL